MKISWTNKRREKGKKNKSIDRSIFVSPSKKKVLCLIVFQRQHFSFLRFSLFFITVCLYQWMKKKLVFFSSFLSLQFHLMMVLTTYWQRHLTFTHAHINTFDKMELGEFNYSLISVGDFCSIHCKFGLKFL
jgi:hypothetical protein